MANYLQLGQALAKHLPMAEGCTSTVKLSKKGIEALAKKNPEFGKAIAEVTEGATNPTLEIAQKAQGNYAIASFKIRSGETVIGKGAYSTSAGANGAVEKMHFEKGDIVTTISKEGSASPVTKEVSKAELATKQAIQSTKSQAERVENIMTDVLSDSALHKEIYGDTLRRGLSELSPAQLKEVETVISEAKENGIRFTQGGMNTTKPRYMDIDLPNEKGEIKSYCVDFDPRNWRFSPFSVEVTENIGRNSKYIEIPTNDVVNRDKMADLYAEGVGGYIKAAVLQAKSLKEAWTKQMAQQVRIGEPRKFSGMGALRDRLKMDGYSDAQVQQILHPSNMAECDFSEAMLKGTGYKKTYLR